jgi:hypothetical protein
MEVSTGSDLASSLLTSVQVPTGRLCQPWEAVLLLT